MEWFTKLMVRIQDLSKKLKDKVKALSLVFLLKRAGQGKLKMEENWVKIGV